MKKIFSLLAFVSVLISSDCSPNGSFQIKLVNTISVDRTDEYIIMNLDSLQEKFPELNIASFTIHENDIEIPYQLEKKDGENFVSFVVDFAPSEEKVISFKNNSENKREYKSRVYAEVAIKVDYNFINGKYTGGRFKNYDSLRVPDGHIDHNALFKYEGPGWESDLVGYRFYIDWRNRIDIFGKKTNELVLKNVGVNDLEAKDDSYHLMQDWGMDIFKVGSSLGIGSFGIFKDSVHTVSKRESVICIISENGPIKAEVKTNYYGWEVIGNKYDLTSVLSITAGCRFTKAELIVSDDPPNLTTGLAKEEHAEYFKNDSEGNWSYFGLYGKQTLAEDNLGIALIYKKNEMIELKETGNSYVVLLKPVDGKVTYYFCAAWEKEPKGIKTKEDFISYLNNSIEKFNNPVLIKY